MEANVPERKERKDWADRVKEIGGLAAVCIGVLAIAGVAIGALIVDTQTAATIAGAAAAAIGSMVGAYFGVKVGTDQTGKAIEAQAEAAAKGTALAAHVPDGKAETALRAAEQAAELLRERAAKSS